MPRYIDVYALKEALLNPVTNELSRITWGDIDNAPTVDAVDVIREAMSKFGDVVKQGRLVGERHGRWIALPVDDEEAYKCSECGDKEYYTCNYCPNCGAKMDEPKSGQRVDKSLDGITEKQG